MEEREDIERREGAANVARRWSFTREAVRELDRLCVEEFGIPTIVLMENAAIGIADAAMGLLRPGGGVPDVADAAAPSDSRWVLAVCGAGNNGGDGLAAIRHLHNRGVRVGAVIAGPDRAYRGDAATNLEICRRMGLALLEAPGDVRQVSKFMRGVLADFGTPELVLDAVLGTGLTRAAEGIALELIRAVNSLHRHGATVLAIDLPSGLDADLGRPPPGGEAVRATRTVTMAGLKVGMARPESAEWTGPVSVADIGAPVELMGRLGRLTEAGK